MRIACLQFSPELGKVSENIAHADRLLENDPPEDIDLLVLPELALTGYNYPSLPSILPYLEPTASGLSTTWAKATAVRHDCIVSVGYPELCSPTPLTDAEAHSIPTVAYDSSVTVSPNGEILAHYRKTHLYYTDETWARESPEGWLSTSLTFAPKTQPEKIVKSGFGICMDLNPHKFTAPWDAYELASHTIASDCDLLILSMAWLTSTPDSSLEIYSKEPDLDTLSYWVQRLKPLVEGEREVYVVFANRSGSEPGKTPFGAEGVKYVGTSWVGMVGRGQVKIWGIMGKGQEGLCTVDTEQEPRFVFNMQSRNDGTTDEE